MYFNACLSHHLKPSSIIYIILQLAKHVMGESFSQDFDLHWHFLKKETLVMKNGRSSLPRRHIDIST
jgi:hypothetical protein